MVTVGLPTLREGAGFALMTILARTEGSGGQTCGIRRRVGLAASTESFTLCSLLLVSMADA